MTDPTTPRPTRYSVLDLTVAQVAKIEDALGIPLSRWGHDAPIGRLAPMVVAEFEGKKPADYADLTVRELADLVSIDGDDGQGEA